MMIAYRTKDWAVFLLGFAKTSAKTLARTSWPRCANWRGFGFTHQPQIAKAIHEGVLQEVSDDEKGN